MLIKATALEIFQKKEPGKVIPVESLLFSEFAKITIKTSYFALEEGYAYPNISLYH